MANETRTLADDFRSGGYEGQFYAHTEEGIFYVIDGMNLNFVNKRCMALTRRFNSSGEYNSHFEEYLDNRLFDRRASQSVVDLILEKNSELAEEK